MKIRSFIGLGLEPFGSVLRRVASQRESILDHAANADDLLRQLAAGSRVDLLIVDSANAKLRVVLEVFRRDSPETILALVHDHSKPCDALREDVFAILNHPISEDTLTVLFDAAERHRDLVNETAYYRAQEASYIDELVGHSELIRKVFQDLYSLARSEKHALLTGARGNGKSLMVRALHRASSRWCKALISVNCHLLPGKLLDRKLFLYKESSVGGLREPFGRLWDLSADGTLYLEGVECVTPEIQQRLFQAIAEQEVERSKGTLVSARRLVMSSRLTVEELMAQGFSRELLGLVTTIRVPSLNERREDIPLLSEYFINSFNQLYGFNAVLGTEAREALYLHDWSFNIRELKATIERGALHAQNGVIVPQHLGLNVGSPEAAPAVAVPPPSPPMPAVVAASPKPLASAAQTNETPPTADVAVVPPAKSQIVFKVGQTLEEIESAMIQKTMVECNNNRTQAAKMLDISVRTLYTKLLDIEQRAKLAAEKNKTAPEA